MTTAEESAPPTTSHESRFHTVLEKANDELWQQSRNRRAEKERLERVNALCAELEDLMTSLKQSTHSYYVGNLCAESYRGRRIFESPWSEKRAKESRTVMEKAATEVKERRE